jgi:ABC-type amino acid transport substrate-binding protein
VEIGVGNLKISKDAIKKGGLEGEFKFLFKGYKEPLGFDFIPSAREKILNKNLKRGIENLMASGKIDEIYNKYNFGCP